MNIIIFLLIPSHFNIHTITLNPGHLGKRANSNRTRRSQNILWRRIRVHRTHLHCKFDSLIPTHSSQYSERKKILGGWEFDGRLQTAMPCNRFFAILKTHDLRQNHPGRRSQFHISAIQNKPPGILLTTVYLTHSNSKRTKIQVFDTFWGLFTHVHFPRFTAHSALPEVSIYTFSPVNSLPRPIFRVYTFEIRAHIAFAAFGTLCTPPYTLKIDQKVHQKSREMSIAPGICTYILPKYQRSPEKKISSS